MRAPAVSCAGRSCVLQFLLLSALAYTAACPGPPGCGKSTVLTMLTRSLGFEVSEWHAPTVVQWKEANYAGMQYR